MGNLAKSKIKFYICDKNELNILRLKLNRLDKSIVRPGNGRLACQKHTAIHCQFRLVYSKLGKTAEVRFDRAKQLNRRRQRRPALYG